MVAPGGGKNFVDVQSVAVAVCNALLQGKNGERYLASGINLSFKEFYTLQKITGNYKQLILGIPDYILEILGRTGDMLRKSGIKTSLCTMNLQQLMIQEYYSNLKAKEELDLPETKLPVAIKKAMDWFKEQHMA
jgi:dihydroflavonol-4-reductase